jgi:hypothetical protein
MPRFVEHIASDADLRRRALQRFSDEIASNELFPALPSRRGAVTR